MNICQPTNECYNCDEYTGAFECLNKTKISQMPELSELQMQDYLDRKCSDIIIPVVSKDCEDSPKNYGLSLKQLMQNIQGTSIGIRQDFPDIFYKQEGETHSVEISLYNNHPLKEMQMMYFAQWSTFSRVRMGNVELRTEIFIDDVKIEPTSLTGNGYNTSLAVGDNIHRNQDAGSLPFFYTKVVPPKTYTKIKMDLICSGFTQGEGNMLVAETIQLMITGVTK